jgi:hypothetical protein
VFIDQHALAHAFHVTSPDMAKQCTRRKRTSIIVTGMIMQAYFTVSKPLVAAAAGGGTDHSPGPCADGDLLDCHLAMEAAQPT